MNKETIEQVTEAVVQIKAIEQIPKASKKPIHDTEFMQHLNTIRTNQLEYFKELTKNRFDQAYFQFNFKDGEVDMWGGDTDIASRIDTVKLPTLPDENLTDLEINKLIVQCENCSSAIYGGLFELQPTQLFYNSVYNWAESVYKALCLTENMWEGECVFAMLVPQDFMNNKLYLDMLVKMYEVKLKQIESTYEKLSRMIALRLVEPGEMQRGQKDFKATEFKK